MDDPRRRAGTIEIGALLAVSVMAVVAVGILRGRSSPTERSTVNIVGDPMSASATADGLTLTISVEQPQVRAGDRLRVDVALHNGRSTPVTWQSDGCEIPFSGGLTVLTPSGATWDGDAASLAPTVDAAAPNPRAELRDARFGGRRDLNCTPPVVSHEVLPGSELRERAVVDVRAAAQAASSDEIAQLTATFPPATVTLPLRVVDAPSRRSSEARALHVFTDDPRLAAFVGSPRTAGWRVDLAWWQDAWELWIDPAGATTTGHSLRMRYDPSTDKVVDVRRVVSGQVPGNDPDFEPVPGSEADVLIP